MANQKIKVTGGAKKTTTTTTTISIGLRKIRSAQAKKQKRGADGRFKS